MKLCKTLNQLLKLGPLLRVQGPATGHDCKPVAPPDRTEKTQIRILKFSLKERNKILQQEIHYYLKLWKDKRLNSTLKLVYMFVQVFKYPTMPHIKDIVITQLEPVMFFKFYRSWRSITNLLLNDESQEDEAAAAGRGLLLGATGQRAVIHYDDVSVFVCCVPLL